jgi:hypothetical protein
MNLEISQNNLYLLLPSKIAWMTDMLSEDKGISIVAAMKEIYLSDTYRHLEQESTKLWHLWPVALYQSVTAMF